MDIITPFDAKRLLSSHSLPAPHIISSPQLATHYSFSDFIDIPMSIQTCRHLVPKISPTNADLHNIFLEQSASTIHSTSSSSFELPNLTNSILSIEQQKQLLTLIHSFPHVFTNTPGRTQITQHHIDLIAGAKPRNSPPYRYAPARRQIIESKLTEMLEQGVITPSKSPWASPVVLAPKKDGSMRFCIDYRKLNEVTIRDAYPIPRIDDTLDALQYAKFFSTLDLRSGYWQVEMDANSKPMTAFVTHKGLFECAVMPFGLTNAPATFQRLMDNVLAGLKWQCCLVYLDDIIIYSPTFDQHLIDLRSVLLALAGAHLTLKASKCNFCRPEMTFLGHLVTPDGIKPDPGLTATITQFPQPQKIKDVQAFLGLTGYYRRFIQNYAKITEPLLQLLRSQNSTTRNIPFTWNEECTTAFETLKKRLVSPPIMHPPDFNHTFILELDACEYGIGCILTQEYNNRKYVIAYASRTLSAAERNYSSVEREALAIVWATKHFRQYLEGGPVIVRSDCKALEWLKTARDPTGRLARWAMKLSPYHIIIQHRPGKLNPNGDFVSRYPLSNSSTDTPGLASIESAVNIWEGTNILQDIQSQQLHDPRLSRIIRILQEHSSVPFGDKHAPYLLLNNLLYKFRHINSYNDQRLVGNKYLLVIPESMQRQILTWAHDHPTAGHAGRIKTLFRLSSRVYWPSMRKDVFKYVQSCPFCQQFKYNNTPTASPMQLHSVTQPWHTIGVDIMGPFPPTPRQKRYLLVVVDYFTRWVEMFALRTITATDMVNILINEVFCRYGIPSYILSDNGPQFVAGLFNEICRSLGMGHKLTANYHPQTNMTERVNRTLKAQIAIYAQRHPGLWDKEIQKLAFAIRTSINETTGDTPAYLNLGRDPQLPLDLILGNRESGPPPTTLEHQYIRNYRANLTHNLKLAFHLVREHSEIKKLIQKSHYDKHTSNQQFLIGDLVWVQIPTPQIGNTAISGKLRPKYQGPCRLVEKLSPSTFVVLRLSDNVNLGSTNVDRMKLYYEPQNNTFPVSPNRCLSPPSDVRRFPLRIRRPPAHY
jgi:transposase InsO family protein